MNPPHPRMATTDDELDHLFQLPFGDFIAARNALAKAARRPDLKQLEKPSLAAWAVNQLHWHHRALLESLAAAATALREQHGQTLAGARADVPAAEHTHREALRACLAAAKGLLAAGGHPATPATLDAIRDTLHAVPTPEVNGRLTHALTRRGLEALAGLVVAPRPTPPTTQSDTLAPEDVSRAALKDGRAEQDERAEQAARERQARREAAETALHEARATLARAETAMAAAAQTLGERQAEHTSARNAVAAAQRLVEACA